MVSDKAFLAGIAMISIAVLEAIALSLGYNGTMLKLALVAIAGLGGWAMPQPKILKGGE